MKGKSGIVYFIQQGEDDYFKIGKTKVSASKRLVGNQVGNPKKLRIYGKVKSDDVSSDENALHNKYASVREVGEWFNLTPYQIGDEIKCWGEKGKLLIVTPKPDGVCKRALNFMLNNVFLVIMYGYLQLLAFNSTLIAVKECIPYISDWFPFHAALTIVICSQPLYGLFFSHLLDSTKKR